MKEIDKRIGDVEKCLREFAANIVEGGVNWDAFWRDHYNYFFENVDNCVTEGDYLVVLTIAIYMPLYSKDPIYERILTAAISAPYSSCRTSAVLLLRRLRRFISKEKFNECFALIEKDTDPSVINNIKILFPKDK
jgi:hypothetical protein